MIEDSPFGRIVVPDPLPAGNALFYTSVDFDGRLNAAIARRITDFIAKRFGIEPTLNTCTQVHGANVVRVSRGATWKECDSCDALFSTEANVALGIKVADCLPVTIMGGGVLANIHSGWRGTLQRITAATLDTIERETSFDPKSSFAYLGPSIRECCFEVGEEVAVQFDANYVDRSRAKAHVDAVRLTADLLRQRGFPAANIVDSGLCTRCDGSIFHSYRREGKGGGRNLAIAAR